MSDKTTTVKLRWDWDAGGTAAKGVKDLADNTQKATAATDALKKAADGLGRRPAGITPTGGGPGNFFGAASTRDALVLEAMRHKGYKDSGLTPADLMRMSDQQLVGLRSQLATPPTKATPTTLLGRVGAGVRSAGAGVAEGLGLGGLGRMGGPAAIAAAAVLAAPALIEGAHAADLVGEHGGGRGSQLRALANGNMVTRNLMGLADSVRGRGQDIQRADEAAERAKVRAEGEEQIRQFRHEQQLNRIGANARYDVLNADRRMAYVGKFDRTTVAGDTAYRESLATQGARQAQINAEKNLKIGEREQADTIRERDSLKSRVPQLRAEYDRLKGGASGGGAGELASLPTADRKLAEVKAAEDRVKALEERIQKGRTNIVGLRAELGRARVGGIQAEMNVNDQREAAAQSQAQRIGAMHPLEVADNVRDLKSVLSHGLAGSNPWEIQAAKRIDPEAVSKLEENRGKEAIKEHGLTKLEGSTIRDNLDDVRKRGDDLRTQAVKLAEEVERETAKGSRDAILSKEFMTAIEGLIRRRVEERIEDIKNKLRMADTRS